MTGGLELGPQIASSWSVLKARLLCRIIECIEFQCVCRIDSIGERIPSSWESGGVKTPHRVTFTLESALLPIWIADITV